MKNMVISLWAITCVLGMMHVVYAVPAALMPSTTLDIASGSGTASGAVSTGHQLFEFVAFAGTTLTVDINVTTGSPDDDSQLYLFDSAGRLLAENDDAFFPLILESLIDSFVVPATGTYFVGVTTYDNRPILDPVSQVITGWEDDGTSIIAFDLIITTVPEPGTLFLLGSGLAGLVAWRRHKRAK